jgi:hypothetical protein
MIAVAVKLNDGLGGAVSLRRLSTVSSYEEINGGAHRKPASILGTPSLVRRIGEIALIGVLTPYYIGTAVFHYLIGTGHELERAAWLLLLTTCTLIVLTRIEAQSCESEGTAKRLAPVWRIFCAYLIFLWVMSFKDLSAPIWLAALSAVSAAAFIFALYHRDHR